VSIAPPNTIVDFVKPLVTPIDPDTPVLDFEKCHGAYMFDRNLERTVVDFASHYASLPLGYNHPGFFEPSYEKDLLMVSRIKIANLDVLTPYYADFLETFVRVVGPEGFPKYFFVEGGALAVENVMKVAFDWKVRRNIRKGKGERGSKILHFKEAFHGRSGYTLTVTNTSDPNKTKFFPKFDWPRVLNPKMRFPMTGANLEATLAAEETSKQQIREIMAREADDIAGILIEPIQGEGGDNHFRPEFLQFLRDTCDEHDTLLLFDEVQTGMGMTGKPWAWQGLGVAPDVFAFAKKAQLGGLVASQRVLDEKDNVFAVPSRISSTWGGSLTDMVRCKRYLEIIEDENLMENARLRGAEIVQKLTVMAERTGLFTNVRGSGLLIAFDVPNPSTRGKLVETLYQNGLMVLLCGDHSMRFRPHLNVTSEVIDEALGILERTLVAFYRAK